MTTTRANNRDNPKHDKWGLFPLDEFRCNHWGHETGIINDQRCGRLAKDGDTFCGRHLVAVNKRRAIVAAAPKMSAETRALLLTELGVTS